MTPLQPQELRRFADVLRLRTGDPLTIRFVEPGDVEPLRRYFEALSVRTHYNRFLGATGGVPSSEYQGCSQPSPRGGTCRNAAVGPIVP